MGGAMDFHSLSGTLDGLLSGLRRRVQRLEYLDDREKQRSKDGLERDLENARATLAKLKELALQNPGSDMSARVQQYSYDLSQMDRDIGRVIHLGPTSTFSPPTTEQGWMDAEKNQRTALLAGNRKLQGTTNTISDAQAIGLDTERIGHGALNELIRQGDVLGETQQDLDAIDKDV